jgi:hypothetical protein
MKSFYHGKFFENLMQLRILIKECQDIKCVILQKMSSFISIL